jgi:hypothetical protein
VLAARGDVAFLAASSSAGSEAGRGLGASGQVWKAANRRKDERQKRRAEGFMESVQPGRKG